MHKRHLRTSKTEVFDEENQKDKLTGNERDHFDSHPPIKLHYLTNLESKQRKNIFPGPGTYKSHIFEGEGRIFAHQEQGPVPKRREKSKVTSGRYIINYVINYIHKILVSKEIKERRLLKGRRVYINSFLKVIK